MSRQTHAIIYADALQQNLHYLQQQAPHSRSIAVLKADAYGHGAVNVARILGEQVAMLAVAIVEEAVVLRDAGIRTPILVLEGPHQPRDCWLAATLDCVLVMHQLEQCEWVAQLPGPRPAIWWKLDTGMHRLGFNETGLLHALECYGSLCCERSALMTHLACADEPDHPITQQQLTAFARVQQRVGLPVSVANSPATLAWPQSHADWNRLGLALYGADPLPQPNPSALPLAPVMSLQAAVIGLRKVAKGQGTGYGQTWIAARDSLIATVGIGYADGYPRHCVNGTPVWLNGQRVPLAGRVSMDMITLDVTDLAQVSLGDNVELWGRHISINEVAASAGTVAYELMTRVSPRVPRLVRYTAE